MKQIRKSFLLILPILFVLVTALPAFAQPPLPTVPTYQFYRWYDTNGNGKFDYWGGDICRGNTAPITVSKVVPPGQLSPFFYAYVTHYDYTVTNSAQLLACKQQSTAFYTGPQPGETWKASTAGGWTQFTAPNPWFGGVELIGIKE